MAMQLTTEDERRLEHIESKLDKVLEVVNGLVTKQSLIDQRVTTLESQPAQAKSVWNLGLNGCATAIMALSALIGAGSFLTALAALAVAIFKP